MLTQIPSQARYNVDMFAKQIAVTDFTTRSRVCLAVLTCLERGARCAPRMYSAVPTR
jgi:hypothetical protein